MPATSSARASALRACGKCGTSFFSSASAIGGMSPAAAVTRRGVRLRAARGGGATMGELVHEPLGAQDDRCRAVRDLRAIVELERARGDAPVLLALGARGGEVHVGLAHLGQRVEPGVRVILHRHAREIVLSQRRITLHVEFAMRPKSFGNMNSPYSASRGGNRRRAPSTSDPSAGDIGFLLLRADGQHAVVQPGLNPLRGGQHGEAARGAGGLGVALWECRAGASSASSRSAPM